MTDIHIGIAQAVDRASVWKDYGVPFSTAVLGALLAYIPSRLLASRASKELLQRDKNARREAEILAARKVFVKLTILVNSIHDYHEQIEEMIARADKEDNAHMPISQRLSVFAGVDREEMLLFDASELEVFIAAKRGDYVDDLVLLARRHSAVLSSLNTFGRIRSEIHFELTKHGITTRDQNLVSTTQSRIPVNLLNYFKVKIEELDLFTQQMRVMISDYDTFAWEVASAYEPITRAYLGEDAVLSLSRRSINK